MENTAGSSTGEFKVRVHCPPDAPSSLRVTALHTDGVTLAWNTPDHDGGLPISGYVIEKRDAYRGGWTIA